MQSLGHTVAERKPPLCLRPCIPHCRWFRKCCKQPDEAETLTQPKSGSTRRMNHILSSNSALRSPKLRGGVVSTTLKEGKRSVITLCWFPCYYIREDLPLHCI